MSRNRSHSRRSGVHRPHPQLGRRAESEDQTPCPPSPGRPSSRATVTNSDAFSTLRIPFVRSFAFGRMMSVLGAQVLTVAVGWQLYERTNDPWSLGLVGVFELAPVLVFMLAAGNAADRYPRRNIAMFATAILALAALALAFISSTGASTAAIYAVLVLVGTARAFAAPSVGTLLPQLLAPAQFANANAWLSSTYELASISGPALGGVMIAMTGTATAAYVVAAAGQIVFIGMLSTLPAIRPPPRAEKHSAREIFAGFAFIRAHPVFLAAITLDLFAVLLGGAVALLPVFAKDILHVGPSGLGYLRAAPALGALSMALLQTRLAPWKRPGKALLVAVVGFGLATVGFGLSRVVWMSLGCLFLTGVFDSVSVVIRMTLEQVITPDRLRGRVSAINYVFIGFSNELGSFESGATAALFGPVASVVGGGIGTLAVVALVVFKWPVLRAIGPLQTLRSPEPSAEVKTV
jgi:MFS family permease